MIWDLPITVEINGKTHNIRNKCDYRVMLDVICALNDNELTNQEKIECALFIFYEDMSEIEDVELAISEIFRIMNGGKSEENPKESKPKLMDWEHDFPQIAPPVSRILGYDVRTPDKYTHWYTFLGGYMEIGDCNFATIISVRSKRAKGKKLEKWEIEYLRENRKLIELPQKLTAEEETMLNSEW